MADETTKRKPGHPVTRWTPEEREALNAKLEAYVDAEDIPILAEFAVQNNIRRQTLYELPELSDTVKKCVEKKEVGLERLMLTGKAVTGCIFSLKQLGWKDTQTIEHSGGIDLLSASDEELDSRIAEYMKKYAAGD